MKYSLVNQHGNGKWTPNEDVFPIKNGEIPASYVRLQEGNPSWLLLLMEEILHQ